ncbi:MAG: hypothetical protein AVDCRST_MAG10-1345, partial [uncultured Acidimicrobiales bacterium]
WLNESRSPAPASPSTTRRSRSAPASGDRSG